MDGHGERARRSLKSLSLQFRLSFLLTILGAFVSTCARAIVCQQPVSPLPVCPLFALVSLVVPASSSVPIFLPLVASAAAPLPLLSAAAPPPAAAPAAGPPAAQMKSYWAYSADR